MSETASDLIHVDYVAALTLAISFFMLHNQDTRSEALDALLSTHGKPSKSIKRFKETIFNVSTAITASGDPFEPDDIINLRDIYWFFQSLEKEIKKGGESCRS